MVCGQVAVGKAVEAMPNSVYDAMRQEISQIFSRDAKRDKLAGTHYATFLQRF